MGELQIRIGHHPDELAERGLGFPAECLHGLGGVTEQVIDLGGTEILGVDFNVLVPVEIEITEGFLEEFAYRIGLAGSNYEVAGLVLLEHEPHGFDVIASETPVAPGVKIAEIELLLQAHFDAAQGPGDLTGNESFATAGRFMVEEDTVADEEIVGFAVVDSPPMRSDFGNSVGAAGIERSGFGLRRLSSAEHLGRTGLVEAHRASRMSHMIANAVEEAEGAHGDAIGGVFGIFERDFDVRLGAEVVDLVGLSDLEDAAESRGICEITVMEVQATTGGVGILVDVVDASRVEARRTADDAVDRIALGEQKFSQVGTVLASDTSDQSRFVHWISFYISDCVGKKTGHEGI